MGGTITPSEKLAIGNKLHQSGSAVVDTKMQIVDAKVQVVDMKVQIVDMKVQILSKACYWGDL